MFGEEEEEEMAAYRKRGHQPSVGGEWRMKQRERGSFRSCFVCFTFKVNDDGEDALFWDWEILPPGNIVFFIWFYFVVFFFFPLVHISLFLFSGEMKEKKKKNSVGVLGRRSAAQLWARRRIAPGVLFPFRKKKRVSFDQESDERNILSRLPRVVMALSLSLSLVSRPANSIWEYIFSLMIFPPPKEIYIYQNACSTDPSSLHLNL